MLGSCELSQVTRCLGRGLRVQGLEGIRICFGSLGFRSGRGEGGGGGGGGFLGCMLKVEGLGRRVLGLKGLRV